VQFVLAQTIENDKKEFHCDINENLETLLMQEDTDDDKKITVDDKGSAKFILTSIDGKKIEVGGTYYLSNLLQELVFKKEAGLDVAEIDSEKIFEPPVQRTSRLIREIYWDGLTRTIDEKGLKNIIVDSKAASEEAFIYIPNSDTLAYDYFKKVAEKFQSSKISVVKLPEKITPEYVKGIKDKPGILTLALEKNQNGEISGVPFVVPGGRFNEMYGWDSYFESLGLINDGRTELAKAMVDNFVYEIKHYGKILNANRSYYYYLTRSQPPFLTSMVLAVYEKLPKNEENHNWLRVCLETCIDEYNNVWMNKERLTSTGLSRYYGNSIGIPPETEPTHYNVLLKPYAEKYKMSIEEFRKKYDTGEIIEPELDEYFVHDISVRESGHDTSVRLEGTSAHLVTVDLNSLLYKYEVDIANIIKEEFGDNFNGEKSSDWFSKAEKRKSLITKYLWNEEDSIFYDYNFVKEEQTNFVSATTFYPLWAGLATEEQAKKLIEKALPLLEMPGGIAGTSKESRGEITEDKPQRQWDYPNGWAPHQILIWNGLTNYGYTQIAERLAYKWLYTILRNAVDYNGTIPEKFDVVERTHKVFAEYGNVGTKFSYMTKEGFGWMNASFQLGLNFLTEDHIEKLNRLIPPEEIFRK
jgi:alpha,alpha-trehalase